MKFKALFFLLISLVFTSAQCGGSHETIASIKKNPQRYADKTMNISGTVKDYGHVALGDAWRSFMLDDGSGSIVVKTHRTILPKSGTQISVSGKLEELIVFGVILEEE
jgi:hypothetical protein